MSNEEIALRYLLYQCIVELEYVRCVEAPGDHSMCATSLGKELIESGQKMLGVPDFSADNLAEFKKLAGLSDD